MATGGIGTYELVNTDTKLDTLLRRKKAWRPGCQCAPLRFKRDKCANPPLVHGKRLRRAPARFLFFLFTTRTENVIISYQPLCTPYLTDLCSMRTLLYKSFKHVQRVFRSHGYGRHCRVHGEMQRWLSKPNHAVRHSCIARRAFNHLLRLWIVCIHNEE